MEKILPHNWRFLALLLAIAIGVSFGVNYLSATSDIAQLRAEAATAGRPLDEVPSVMADAVARTMGSFYGLFDMTNILLVGGAALLLGHGVRKFIFPSSLGSHTGAAFNEGWKALSATERTRWVLGVIFGILFAALAGRAQGASVKHHVPMVEISGLSLPVSEAARDLIIHYEVGGRSYYEKQLSAPTVPAWRTTASGVTIMFGVDVGHMTDAQIASALDGVVPGSSIRALQSVNGLKGSSAYYNGLPKVKHLRFTWDQATKVFERDTLPRFTAQTKSAFRIDSNKIHGHESGALTSLVFNRGPAMGTSSSRLEMRAIRDDIARGDHSRIPARIRAMKRLWSYTSLKGLHLRRDAEANLYAEGSKLRIHGPAKDWR